MICRDCLKIENKRVFWETGEVSIKSRIEESNKEKLQLNIEIKGIIYFLNIKYMILFYSTKLYLFREKYLYNINMKATISLFWLLFFI